MQKGTYFSICKNIYLCKTYSFAYAKIYVLHNLWKLYILNKKRHAFHEEAPTIKITIRLLFFAYDDMYLTFFEVIHVEEGGIMIHQRCVEY